MRKSSTVLAKLIENCEKFVTKVNERDEKAINDAL